jgi:hypothetical protein
MALEAILDYLDDRLMGWYYDPRVTGVIVTAVAVAVTAIWGSKTLARRIDAVD